MRLGVERPPCAHSCVFSLLAPGVINSSLYNKDLKLNIKKLNSLLLIYYSY